MHTDINQIYLIWSSNKERKAKEKNVFSQKPFIVAALLIPCVANMNMKNNKDVLPINPWMLYLNFSGLTFHVFA